MCKNRQNEKDLLRAPNSVARYHSTRASRRGKKMLNCSRDNNEGTYRSGEGGGGPAMRTPDLSYYLEGARDLRVMRG